MVDSLRSSVSNWGLSQDLQSFSNSLVLKTKSLENELSDMVHSAKAAEIKLNNCFNEFLLISNTQFVEHRVYEDDDEVVQQQEVKGEDVVKDTANLEAEAMARFASALNSGLVALDAYAAPHTDIVKNEVGVAPNGDVKPEEEESKPHLATVFTASKNDVYNNKPLPHVIGTTSFMEDNTLGLGINLEHGESSDEEESESEEESEESSEEESSDEEGTSDESDTSEKPKIKKSTGPPAGVGGPPVGIGGPPTAAMPGPPKALLSPKGTETEDDSDEYDSDVSKKVNKAPVKVQKATTKQTGWGDSSEDEDIGGKKSKFENNKAASFKDQLTSQIGAKPASKKPSAFNDNDDDNGWGDDDVPSTKPTVKAKSKAISDDENEEIPKKGNFADKLNSTLVASKSSKKVSEEEESTNWDDEKTTETKQNRTRSTSGASKKKNSKKEKEKDSSAGLFGADENEDDLFSGASFLKTGSSASNNPKRNSVFSLFGSASNASENIFAGASTSSKQQPVAASKSAQKFFDEEDESSFSIPKSDPVKTSTVSNLTEDKKIVAKKSALFGDSDEESSMFNTSKPAVSTASTAISKPVPSSLFGDDNEDDIFSTLKNSSAKEPSKQPVTSKKTTLFADDDTKTTSSETVESKPAAATKKNVVTSLFGLGGDDDESLNFGNISSKKTDIKSTKMTSEESSLVSTSKKTEVVATKSLFGDDDTDDLFSAPKKVKSAADNKSSATTIAKSSSLFGDDESDDLFGLPKPKNVAKTSNVAVFVPPPPKLNKKITKGNVFDDSEPSENKAPSKGEDISNIDASTTETGTISTADRMAKLSGGSRMILPPTKNNEENLSEKNLDVTSANENNKNEAITTNTSEDTKSSVVQESTVDRMARLSNGPRMILPSVMQSKSISDSNDIEKKEVGNNAIESKSQKKTASSLFDGDEDDGLFNTKGKDQIKVIASKEVVSKINDKLTEHVTEGVTEKIESISKSNEKAKKLTSGLFDEDGDDDLFKPKLKSSDSKPKPASESSSLVKAKKSVTSLFDDDGDDLFKPKSKVNSDKPILKPTESSEAPKPDSKKSVSSLFDDDGEDLFKPKSKVSTETSKINTSKPIKSEEKIEAPKLESKKTASALFDDDGDDLFKPKIKEVSRESISNAPVKIDEVIETKPAAKKPSSLFEDDGDDLFKSKSKTTSEVSKAGSNVDLLSEEVIKSEKQTKNVSEDSSSSTNVISTADRMAKLSGAPRMILPVKSGSDKLDTTADIVTEDNKLNGDSSKLVSNNPVVLPGPVPFIRKSSNKEIASTLPTISEHESNDPNDLSAAEKPTVKDLLKQSTVSGGIHAKMASLSFNPAAMLPGAKPKPAVVTEPVVLDHATMGRATFKRKGRKAPSSVAAPESVEDTGPSTSNSSSNESTIAFESGEEYNSNSVVKPVKDQTDNAKDVTKVPNLDETKQAILSIKPKATKAVSLFGDDDLFSPKVVENDVAPTVIVKSTQRKSLLLDETDDIFAKSSAKSASSLFPSTDVSKSEHVPIKSAVLESDILKQESIPAKIPEKAPVNVNVNSTKKSALFDDDDLFGSKSKSNEIVKEEPKSAKRSDLFGSESKLNEEPKAAKKIDLFGSDDITDMFATKAKVTAPAAKTTTKSLFGDDDDFLVPKKKDEKKKVKTSIFDD